MGDHSCSFIGFLPSVVDKLRSGGTTIAGSVPIGGTAPALQRCGVGRLWPDIVALTDEAPASGFHFAIDGYLVRDGRLCLGLGDEARLLASTFRADPSAFMAGIENGCCNIVAHDAARQVTTIANDPSGCLPLYLHRGRERIAFASDLAGLSAVAPNLILDPVGCAEVYWFGYPIGDRTLYRDVQCIPPGVILTIDWRTGAIATENWAQPPRMAQPTGNDIGADLVDAMRTACRRLHNPERRTAIKLSGGMDSRLIAGCWPESDLRAFTFAAPGAIECRITRRLAEALGMPISVAPVHGDFFSTLQVPLLARYGNVDYFHQALLPDMAKAGIDCALDGLAGDVLFGGLALKRKGGFRAALRNALGLAGRSPDVQVSNDAAAELIFSQIFVPDAALRVLQPDAQREIDLQRPEVLADIAREYAQCDPGAAFERRYIRFAIRNRMRRNIALQGAACRPQVETLYPFLDRDVQALAGRIGSTDTAGKRFYRRLYREQLPRIAGVPLADSLLSPRAPNLAHVLGRIMRYGMEAAGNRLSLLFRKDLPFWRVNSVQWPRWIAFDSAFIAGIRRSMQTSAAFDATRFDAAMDRVRRGTPLTGTRLMQTAGYLGFISGIPREAR